MGASTAIFMKRVQYSNMFGKIDHGCAPSFDVP